MKRPTANLHGQESYLLKTDTIEAAVTRLGGMLGPVTFFPQDAAPVRPYAIAPWAEETVAADTPAMLRALRGDWFCSAFGENREPYAGHRLPPHGETANGNWQAVDGNETSTGSWLCLKIDLPLQGGVCLATTALLAGHSVVYQRHDLSGLGGPINPGHHATLAFPDVEGAGNLSFSRLCLARTYFEPTARPDEGGDSYLKPDVEITDLGVVPGIDGSTTDIRRYPARRGFEDIAILCADPKLDFAWSAVTFPEQHFVWFTLRNPRQLASTLLWFSNGGRRFPPWNGRHINVLGIEDITGYFHVGIAASCRENVLNQRGIRTCLEPSGAGGLSIPYIQGVARVPPGFDRLASIEPRPNGGGILLRSDAGPVVPVHCQVDFLRTGILPALPLP